METLNFGGESLIVPERVIVAPAPGRFRPVDGGSGDTNGPATAAESGGPATAAESGGPATAAESGVTVSTEQVIGFVDGVGHSTEVRSPFAGLMMGLMAHAGERVREGQPVAWMRLA